MVTLRDAQSTDVPAIAAIATENRERLAGWEPEFWKLADGGATIHQSFLAVLVENDSVITVVAEQDGRVAGFAIANLIEAPPLYDLDGRTALIDDFGIGDVERWSELGPLLLDAVAERAAMNGAVQTIVITATQDEPRRSMLEGRGLRPTSEWWLERY
jgi:GNAT superfamily N-acetyltransferase